MKKIILTTTLLSAIAFNATADVDTHLYNKYWDEDSPNLFHTNPNDILGSSFAKGDFNNDGYEDLVIGEPGYDNAKGDVMVLYGTGSGVSSIGSVYLAQASAENNDSFGAVMAVGDFNGDGIDDLAIAAPNEDIDSNTLQDAGAINIFYGSNTGLPQTAPEINENTGQTIGLSAAAFNNFGFSLAAGDINGDGKDELAVGIPASDIAFGFPPTTYTDAGRIRIFNGKSTGITGTDFFDIWQGNGATGAVEDSDNFGYSLAMGYFDDGNYADLAVGVPYESLHATFDGIVQVFYGGAAGFVSNSIVTQNEINGSTPESNDLFGFSLTTGNVYGGIGDFYDDLVVGVPFEDVGSTSDTGVVHVMPGSASGLISAGSYTLSQGTSGINGFVEQGDHFGYSVATAILSDNSVLLNDSILIGTPGEDFQATNDGVAYVVFDSSASSATSKFLSSPSPNNEAHFGNAIGAVTTYFDNAHLYRFTSVFVGIPGQISSDNDTNAGAFLEAVFQGNDIIFKHGFE